jgi:methyl-galactoside transport system substrate-binding protein
MNDSQNSQATQNDQVDTMISKGAKSLAINLVDPQAASAIIEKAKAADLPVIFFNKEPDAAVLASYDKAWYVGTTSAESGIIQGEVIVNAWTANPTWDRNGDGVMSYVLLKGEPGHPDAEARTKYVVETVVAAGIKVEELELQTGMWDSVKGKELMDAWIAKHGDAIEMVICNNDGMALGAIQSLNASGYFEGDKFMPVVGVDAIPDALEQIKAGKMVGTVLNDAKNQGGATFDLALNVANGKDPLEGTEWTLDETKAVRVPYVAVTIDNIAFAEEAYK